MKNLLFLSVLFILYQPSFAQNKRDSIFIVLSEDLLNKIDYSLNNSRDTIDKNRKKEHDNFVINIIGVPWIRELRNRALSRDSLTKKSGLNAVPFQLKHYNFVNFSDLEKSVKYRKKMEDSTNIMRLKYLNNCAKLPSLKLKIPEVEYQKFNILYIKEEDISFQNKWDFIEEILNYKFLFIRLEDNIFYEVKYSSFCEDVITDIE